MERGIATMEDGRYLDASIDHAQEMLEGIRTLIDKCMADVVVRSISLHTGGLRSAPQITVVCQTSDGRHHFKVSMS